MSELQISNRVENVKRKTSSNSRIFTKARVNIKLSLGQIIRDTVYFEAESQFQSQAYFKTTIQMSNAIQGGGNDEKSSDVIHINLIRPLVFVQPVAVDRAILFWLSYKNAWEYWTEQRLNLNKEVLAATEQVLEKVNRSYIREDVRRFSEIFDLTTFLPFSTLKRPIFWGHFEPPYLP